MRKAAVNARDSERRRGDIAAALFALTLAINTTLLATVDALWALVPLAAIQSLLLLGCQEAKHLAAHRTLFGHARVNDLAGTLAAALIGENFIAFRYFHVQHHRRACSDDDPEGRLYALSWRTRWIWLLAPLEVFWVAWHLGRVGRTLVPGRHRDAWHAAHCATIATAAALCALAATHPHAVLWCYAIPLVCAAWLDFPLTQAEHYGSRIVGAEASHGRDAHANDVVLPVLGWLLLQRSLHRVHHRAPAAPWHTALRRLHADPSARPITYAAFVRRWLAHGPRKWPHADASAAHCTRRPLAPADRRGMSRLLA